MTLKITLKAARVNKNLSQDDACRIIGVSKKTLSNWEHGKTFPQKKEHIDKICELYNVRYDELIFLPANYA